MRQPSVYYAVDKEDVDLKIEQLEESILEVKNDIIKALLELELEIYKNIRIEYPVYTDNEWHK